MAFTFITACGVKTSGVRSLGSNTFTVSADHINASTAKGTALGLAESHCTERQQEILVTKVLKRHKVRYFYDITFQCLNAGDPRLENPEYETIYESN
jgi:hypothetical protein